MAVPQDHKTKRAGCVSSLGGMEKIKGTICRAPTEIRRVGEPPLAGGFYWFFLFGFFFFFLFFFLEFVAYEFEDGDFGALPDALASGDYAFVPTNPSPHPRSHFSED